MEKLAHRAIFLFVFLFGGTSFLFSGTTKFDEVKLRRHKSAEKRELVGKFGVLSFDDDAQQLTFRGVSSHSLKTRADWAWISRRARRITSSRRPFREL